MSWVEDKKKKCDLGLRGLFWDEDWTGWTWKGKQWAGTEKSWKTCGIGRRDLGINDIISRSRNRDSARTGGLDRKTAKTKVFRRRWRGAYEILKTGVKGTVYLVSNNPSSRAACSIHNSFLKIFVWSSLNYIFYSFVFWKLFLFSFVGYM